MAETTTGTKYGTGILTTVEESTPSASNLKIQIYADGADADTMVELAKDPMIKGFTTNPTLMRAAGVVDFEVFCNQLLVAIPNKPISFEVFADDWENMKRQALKIASWGQNVYVKIPVTNTAGESAVPLIRELTQQGVKLNITAIMTPAQVSEVTEGLAGGAPAIVSVFAGRIADTGRDPMPLMSECVGIVSSQPQAQLLWASPRELLNIFQADAIGCHIITATKDVLKKLSSVGKDLDVFSLDTVKMFFNDAQTAGYKL